MNQEDQMFFAGMNHNDPIPEPGPEPADWLFSPGQVLATPGVLRIVRSTGEPLGPHLARHLHGDWGELCDEDKATNDDALKHGARLLSAYRLRDNTRIWLITEWDRSVTTFLLPEEY